MVIANARVAFTVLAYNVAQIAKTHAERNLTAKGIRTLQRQLALRFGSIPNIVLSANDYAVHHLEELIHLYWVASPRSSHSVNPQPT